jgi:GDP-4-dehydro-6-deoxy-D-mannose reductase
VRALVTGASGFAGTHLLARLQQDGHDVAAPAFDVRDRDATVGAVAAAQPDVVFHLAAQAFVPQSLHEPDETYAVNVLGTANVLAALRERRAAGAGARLLFVSSADVYGAHDPQAYPLTETVAPKPANPYAASKLAAEALVLGEVRAFGLDAVITRAFNHIGPSQDERFAVASFAAQLAAIANGAEPKMFVGNLTAKRDFLDVRDVADAYVKLAQSGASGEIYNVCSGTAVSMREILGELIRIAHVPVEVREDPQRMRPSDVPLVYGSNEKLREACGWTAHIPLRRSLQDVYAGALMSRA